MTDFESDEPPSTPALTAIVYADRLVLYSDRIKRKLWSGDKRLQVDALADAAEAGFIASRLYGYLQKMINGKEG